ncbi:hypothetical protein D3C86_1965700 [compost metagenome]
MKAKSGDDFVVNDKRTVIMRHLAEPLKKARFRHDHAEISYDWLDYNGGDVFSPCI